MAEGSDVSGHSSLRGRRVLAIGSSAGAGRAVALALAQRGATVAFAARRGEKVAELAKNVGNGAVGLQCDIRQESSCQEVVDRAAEALGGLDAVLYAPAIIAMSTLMDADGSYWDEVLRTNVTGAALVTRAAISHLGATRGRMVYFSSVSSSGPAWPGLGVYITSKAALERMVEAWRTEHPEVLFTCLSIGPIASDRDADDIAAISITEPMMKVITTHMPTWEELRLARPPLPDSQIAQHVAAVLESDADVEHMVIQAPW
jgi:NAD(P)-dependent dehydrogenase (short-subunit alcohol dehydrogenase family)